MVLNRGSKDTDFEGDFEGIIARKADRSWYKQAGQLIDFQCDKIPERQKPN